MRLSGCKTSSPDGVRWIGHNCHNILACDAIFCSYTIHSIAARAQSHTTTLNSAKARCTMHTVVHSQPELYPTYQTPWNCAGMPAHSCVLHVPHAAFQQALICKRPMAPHHNCQRPEHAQLRIHCKVQQLQPWQRQQQAQGFRVPPGSCQRCTTNLMSSWCMAHHTNRQHITRSSHSINTIGRVCAPRCVVHCAACYVIQS
jgi:hypothetical protein